MTSVEILNSLGQFSSFDYELFDKHTSKLRLNRNDIVVKEGEVCKSFYFVLQGSFVQFQSNEEEEEEQVFDLHLNNEWMFNQESLTEQLPSMTSIRAFSKSEILTLSLNSFHCLCSKS